MGGVFKKPEVPKQSTAEKKAIEDQRKSLEEERKKLIAEEESRNSGQQGIRSLLGAGSLSGFRDSGGGRGLLK